MIFSFLQLRGQILNKELPVWPTNNSDFLQKPLHISLINKPLESFLQATASGVIQSATFGFVRNNGQRFHEGIDIKSVQRSRRGIPRDCVQAVLKGRVVYLQKYPNKSSYGYYVVLEHGDENFHYYTLYAHLAKINAGLFVGKKVKAGDNLGVLGHTSSGGIPLIRAHTHFEIGVAVGSQANFEKWYQSQNFKQKNLHGRWNGLNLIGLDPLAFFKSGMSFENFYQKQPIAYTIRIKTKKIPFFLQTHTSLLRNPLSINRLCGWDLHFHALGFIVEATPLYDEKLFQHFPKEGYKIFIKNLEEIGLWKNRHCIEFSRNNQPFLGKFMKKIYFLLFGENCWGKKAFEQQFDVGKTRNTHHK